MAVTDRRYERVLNYTYVHSGIRYELIPHFTLHTPNYPLNTRHYPLTAPTDVRWILCFIAAEIKIKNKIFRNLHISMQFFLIFGVIGERDFSAAQNRNIKMTSDRKKPTSKPKKADNDNEYEYDYDYENEYVNEKNNIYMSASADRRAPFDYQAVINSFNNN